jgi:hypothetical protein
MVTEIWQRTLSVYVDVTIEWLLPNGECPTNDNAVAADAWRELLDDVRRHLRGLYQGTSHPTFDVDWEDKPERKDKYT